MKKIVTSLVMVLTLGLIVTGATAAYFSDTETSVGNTFTAGTLDLNLDGANVNVVKFNVANMVPGNQPTKHWTLKNVGSVNGFLDIENVKVTGFENGVTEPETEAGDVTSGAEEGELQNVLGVYLFLDKAPVTGWFGAEDVVIYNGLAKDMPTHFEMNAALNSGVEANVQGIINWWSTADDNKAQSDSMTLDMTYELGQTSGQ